MKRLRNIDTDSIFNVCASIAMVLLAISTFMLTLTMLLDFFKQL